MSTDDMNTPTTTDDDTVPLLDRNLYRTIKKMDRTTLEGLLSDLFERVVIGQTLTARQAPLLAPEGIRHRIARRGPLVQDHHRSAVARALERLQLHHVVHMHHA